MKCPVCTGVDLKIAERQGVEIDYCTECRGIWLDRGELDKIIERSFTQQPANVQPGPQNKYQDHNQQSYAQQHYDKHGNGQHAYHKRKSWLSELFD
jgi:Zn-finger nucleic acid-binding protein